jgi:vesicle coat complex subunit
MEFKEYATEVDVEFVRRAVRAIGRCAIKLERAAEKCINVLLELIQVRMCVCMRVCDCVFMLDSVWQAVCACRFCVCIFLI